MLQRVNKDMRQGLLLKEITPEEIVNKQGQRESFVVNIVTSWCPDCTVRQAQFIEDFAGKLQNLGLAVFQCTVQHERGVFIGGEHENLTASCGGHGYPRTVLFINGEIADWENVEIVTAEGLGDLAERFLSKVGSSH